MLLTHSTTDLLMTIALKSRSLSERLQNWSDSAEISEDSAEIEQRLDFWCQVVAKGDRQKFQKRLAWDGLSLETARSLVSTTTQIQITDLPAWTRTLARVMTAAQMQHSEAQLDRALNPDRPIPFEDFYLPCLTVARQLLQASLNSPNDYNLLSEAAQIALERQLLDRLVTICAPTLMQEFVKFRTTGDALRDFLTITIQRSTQRDRYQAFIKAQLQDGLHELLSEYSVLGKLIATVIELWVESTAEFVQRLAADWLAIEQQFSPQQALTQVVSLKVGLSDTHKRGRSVSILTFDTGMKLVYKPKDLALESAFGQLLNWINQQGFALTFKSPRILNQTTHGWAEFIEALPCHSEAEVYRFYQRSGMLLCLIHVLEGTDCHYENLIASGEYPVLVDMETLLHPTIIPPNSLGTDAIAQLSKKLEKSVLQTALLPLEALTVNDNLFSIDLSGLGNVEEQAIPSLVWKFINTNGMTVDTELVSVTSEANLPTLEGAIASPEPFISAIVNGFDQMYSWLIERRITLLAADSPLMAFAHQECRLVFRNTRTYGAILAQSYSPDLMKAGIARSVGLEVLSRPFLVNPEKPIFWQILATEIQAMEQLDIPLLTANTSSPHLHLDTDTTIFDLYEKTSFDRVIAHIQALDQSDRLFQRQVVQFALCARFLQEPQENLTSARTASLQPNELLNQAIQIAHTLQQQAWGTLDDGLEWLSMKYQHRHQSFYLQSTGFNLYDGCCGIALFLGALAKVSGEREWQDLSLATLYPLRRVLHNLDTETGNRLRRRLGIGGGDGLASMIYALTRLSQWLDEPELQDDALQLTTLITPTMITSDRTFDVVGGVAGTLLGLLTLLDRVEGKSHAVLLEQSIACGQHLVDHQTGIEEHCKAWATGRNQQHLTGFSQGAAGVAYALLRLFAVTQETRWREAAMAAIAYEQTQFSAITQNWIDLRSSPSEDQPAFSVSWAHGAPGITLARLGGLLALNTATIQEEIAIGLQTTQTHLLGDNDSLCWGNLGRIETLVVAAQRLHQPDYLANAYQAAAHVIQKMQTQGAFNLSHYQQIHPEVNVMNPGFFQGLSGIGYEFLRIAYPDQLPSILLWE